MKYYVAESYNMMDRVGEPFEKDNKLYTRVVGNCDRCGGTGIFACRIENGYPVPHPAHNGVCLKCNGAGKIEKVVRLYSESQYNSMQKTKANRRAKAEETRRKTAADRKAKRFSNWLKWNGFDEEGNTYLIYGRTYRIKDQLKEEGCKFSKELKWHGPAAVDVPEDCFVERIHWSDVYNWNEDIGEMEKTEKGDQFLTDIFSKNSLGMFLGEVGERLRNLEVIFEKDVEFEGPYGRSHSYRFNADGAQLTWFTTKDLDLEEGEHYTLTGTVKKHEVYGNVKTTYLNRCIVK